MTRYPSTERDDLQDEMRAEQRRPARLCLECGCKGYHTENCPASDDETDDEPQGD